MKLKWTNLIPFHVYVCMEVYESIQCRYKREQGRERTQHKGRERQKECERESKWEIILSRVECGRRGRRDQWRGESEGLREDIRSLGMEEVETHS